MAFIRAILGAIVGGVLGIGLLVLLGVYAHFEATWIMVVVGLLAGLSMKVIADTGHVNYLRGALAALVAVGAFVGGKLLVAQILSDAEATQTAVAAGELDVQGDEEDGTEAMTVEIATDAIEAPQDVPTVIPTGNPTGAPLSNNGNVLDAIWLALAALVAYQFGKGHAAKPAAGASAGSTGDGDAPAEGGEEASSEEKKD